MDRSSAHHAQSRLDLNGVRGRTCREGGEGGGVESRGVENLGLAGRSINAQVNVATADRAADMRIGSAQLTLIVVRCRLILLRQRVRDAMRHRTLLREQQGEDEQG